MLVDRRAQRDRASAEVRARLLKRLELRRCVLGFAEVDPDSFFSSLWRLHNIHCVYMYMCLSNVRSSYTFIEPSPTSLYIAILRTYFLSTATWRLSRNHRQCSRTPSIIRLPATHVALRFEHQIYKEHTCNRQSLLVSDWCGILTES